MLETEKIRQLIEQALTARTFSYSPYSHFQVGAALLTKDGKIYSGCNIENAAYGPSNCAERTAIFKAVSEGQLEFAAIAITGGVCRQVMMEFCEPDFEIIVAKSETEYKVYTLKELLPEGFGRANLQ